MKQVNVTLYDLSDDDFEKLYEAGRKYVGPPAFGATHDDGERDLAARLAVVELVAKFLSGRGPRIVNLGKSS